LIPERIDDVSAAGIPIAYLTAHMALSLAGFQASKTVLAPAIGGPVGNAVTQLARALGAEGCGSDIVIDAIGGDVLTEAHGTLAIGGSLTTLGYSASRKSTIDLIWKRASIKSFSLFAQPSEMWRTA
jgi:NADPH2:quinone reductase